MMCDYCGSTLKKLDNITYGCMNINCPERRKLKNGEVAIICKFIR